MRFGTLNGLKSLGLIALLVTVLGQSGLLLHKTSIDHATEETCEVCSSFDRQTSTPSSESFEQFNIVASATLPDRASFTIPTQETRIHRLRGPPIL